ncbi:MAG: diaminopimelate epimerase [Gemmatimonadaceae bacterium]|nr:diaminopimelate epimerase [Gemmatimonadaceae bacterium]
MAEAALGERARAFYKMSGSGNDFVFFRSDDPELDPLGSSGIVKALCIRETGVGADGVVLLGAHGDNAIRIRYFNSDGSLGELCGNATLCATRLAPELGLIQSAEFEIHTDSGVVAARMRDGLPEVDLAPVSEISDAADGIERLARESCIGFARAGVPHIVIVDDELETADVVGRGSRLRHDPSLRDGANVNFVAPAKDGEWAMRTFERGVEGETLACGTGAVASAILLSRWGRAEGPVRLRTRSGRTLEVRLHQQGDAWYPSLRGAAHIVFTGQLRDFRPTEGRDEAPAASAS